MPNTPSVIGEGATVFSVGSNVRNGDSEIARNLFSRLGICLQGDESIVDAVMAVSGSGPAYVSNRLRVPYLEANLYFATVVGDN